MRNKKSAARRFDKDAGAAFGLIIGIIIGSALLNVAWPASGRLALGTLSAMVQTVAAEFWLTKNLTGL